jgi:diguanylate cyclase (GGDEF)-like protein/PAS domain S-box-containing protein
VIGAHIASCFAPEGKDALLALLADGALGKRSIELDLRTEGGARVPTLLSVSPLLLKGLPGAVCMIATDLTGQKRGEAAIQARQTLLKVLEAQKRTEESLRVSLQTLQLHDSALGAISQGVIITDPNSRTTYVNAAFESITGYTKADVIGRSCSLLQGPGTSRATRRALADAVHAGRPFHGELLNYRKDGTAFWNEMSITPVFDANGVLTQFVGVQRDVSAHRQAEEQLILAAKVFEQSNEGIVITDAMNHIIKINPAFSAITGFSQAEVLGQNPRMLGSGCHDAAFFHAMWNALDTCGRWQGEVWNRHKDGALYLLSMSLSRVCDAAGRPTQYIASFSDITQRKEAESNMLRMAHFDPLTGLPNRALLSDRATHAFQEAHRNHESIALMFIDLDRFKNVNDSLGHRIGDALLMEVARRMKNTLREQDTVSRVGGDEFVLLLPDTDADGAAHLAQKLVSSLRLPFQIGEHELLIGSSIGIALFPSDGTDFEALCKSADAAMYRAKQEGGNAFHFYTDEIQARSERVLSLENALRHALERGQMQLYYQPQKSFCGGRIFGAEALLRWQHPKLGLVSPGEFIPIAENSGLINSIGEWVLRTAVHQMRDWLDAGMAPITIAVNLSAVQFRQKNLLDLVSLILEEGGIPPQYLELELTESVASDDPLGAIAVMDKLNARGIRMSIDDFGTGYSSLSYLKRFKAYRLKIDKSFVHNITENAEDQAIVTAIISLASSLGMQTIAEGVETAAQMAFLRDKGCDEMQGYWLSWPLPAEQFKDFVEAAQ